MFTTNTESISADSNQLKVRLTAAFAHKPYKAATVDTNSYSDSNKHYQILGMHGYSILGFDPSGSDGGTITLRNPWGLADNSPLGRFAMPLKDFQKLFGTVRIEK
jgi:hypothetical protein